MTKSIRIENADNSDHKVIVQIWDIVGNGEPDVLYDEISLDYPTQMSELTIWDSRYLVVKEK